MIKPKMTPAEEICFVMTKAYERNMVSSAGGCLSIRDGEGNMWISPTSEDKGGLKPDMIAKYSGDGNQLSEYKGSMEWTNHLAIYRAREDVKAIFHTHSSGVLSSAFAREAVNIRRFANEADIIKEVAEVPFSVPASDELCDDIVRLVKSGANVLTLDSHGTYVLSAEGLLEAFAVQDMFEMAARADALAPSIGNVLPELSGHQMKAYTEEKEKEHFETNDAEEESEEIKAQRHHLCNLISRGYQNRIIDCLQASFSVKIGEDDFLINPANHFVGELKPEDLVRVKSGKVEKGKTAPYRTGIHREIYRTQSYAGSVLINASSYAGIYCITDAAFDITIDPELVFCIKGVKKLPFLSAPKDIAKTFSQDMQVVFVENDCVISTGTNGVKTLGIAECLEYATRAVSEMYVKGRRPVSIAEYSK